MLKNIKSILKANKALLRTKMSSTSEKCYKALKRPLNWQIGVFMASILLWVGCAPLKYVPLESKEHIVREVRDSIIYRDSIVYIPQERVVEVVPKLDTLRMEIETAQSKAYLDTTQMVLRGELKSKKATQEKYVEKIVYKERIDTFYFETPIPYEVDKPIPYVPTFYKFCLWWFIGTLLLIAVFVFLKIRPF